MYILLYVKLLWCSSISYIYGQFQGGTFAHFVQWYSIDLWSIGGGGLGICAFCYMLNFCGVMVFHTYMVNWRGLHLP